MLAGDTTGLPRLTKAELTPSVPERGECCLPAQQRGYRLPGHPRRRVLQLFIPAMREGKAVQGCVTLPVRAHGVAAGRQTVP
jgi:hypothetical protein